MATNIVPFQYKSNSIRVVMIDGEPWFVGKDICDALDHSNHRAAIDRLDNDEKGVTSVYTPGGKQDMTVVSESGMYSLILTSRKTEAKVFKKWITSEVLPSIRKNGSYSIASPEHKIPQTYAEALLEAGRLALENEKLSNKIEQDAPLVKFANEIKSSDDSIDFNAFAKMIGTGRTRLFRTMRACGVVIQNSNLPYQRWIDAGYFEVSQELNADNGKLIPFALVTGKGQLWLHDRLKKHETETLADYQPALNFGSL